MTKLSSAVLSMAFIAGLTSCKKENENTGVSITPTTYSSLYEAYGDVETKAKTYSVDATNGSYFRGPMGSRFVFPANAFMTPTGQPVSGTVQVAVREFLKPSDAIFSRILPSSFGEPLISGGAAWVFATQNGNTVILRPGASYTVHLPQRFGLPALPGMSYYLGANVDSSASLSLVNWVTDAGGFVSNLVDTISITSDSLTFIAAGIQAPLIDPDTFNINVAGATLPATRGSGNAAVYTLYRATNTVVPVLDFYGSSKRDIIREDIEQHVVAIALINGDLHAGTTTFTPKSGDTYTVNISKMSPAELKAKIDALR